MMTRLADDDVGLNVLSCRADILGTTRQVILRQSLYSTFVYLDMFQGLAMQQSTGYCPVGTTASNGLYSYLCVSVHFFRNCQCTSLQGIVQLVQQQAIDCTSLCVSVYFSAIGNAAVYRVLSSWYYSKQWTGLFLLTYTLSSN